MSKNDDQKGVVVGPEKPVLGSDLNAVMLYWQTRRDELAKQISEIESFLGFIEVSDSLAVRVSKLELFLGLKAA